MCPRRKQIDGGNIFTVTVDKADGITTGIRKLNYTGKVYRGSSSTDLNSHLKGRAATFQNFSHCLTTCPFQLLLAGYSSWSLHLGHGSAGGHRAFLTSRDRM